MVALLCALGLYPRTAQSLDLTQVNLHHTDAPKAALASDSRPAHPAVRQLAALPDAAPAGSERLSDAELGEVNAGDFQVALDGFNVAIENNEAGLFTLDIAQSAFNGATGLFTTLQAVNSAVDLTVIVNIYINGQGA